MSDEILQWAHMLGITYVALTDKRINAIKRAIRALNEEQLEYQTIDSPTPRDFEIEAAVEVLEEMLKLAQSIKA